MKALATWLSKQCVHYNIIEDDLFDWCVYCIEKRLVSFLSRLSLFFIGFILFGASQSIIFIACFFFLRKITNGYHASTYLGCLSLSIFVEVSCLLLAQILPYKLAIITVFFSDILIAVRAPINDIKIHLDASEIIALKSKIKRSLFFINCVYVVLLLFQISLSNYVSVALLADSISLHIKR